MKFKPSKRALAHSLAFLAGLMMVVWPAFASAICCCDHGDKLSPVVKIELPACPHCAAAVKSDANEAESGGCDCGLGCRSHLAAVTSPSIQFGDQWSVATVSMVDGLAFPDSIGISLGFANAKPPLILSAQDHCAQICCWLK